MKKMVAVLLCAAMWMMVVNAMAVDTADVTGVWYMYATELNGTLMTQEELGMQVELTLNEDGTGSMTKVGVQALEGNWTMDEAGVITLANERGVIAKYQYQDAEIVVIESTVTMYFGRVPMGLYRPVGKVAEREEDFYGIYELAFLYNENSILSAEQAGMEGTFMISAQGLISTDENGEAVTIPFVFAPVSGMLAITDGSFAMAAQLNEDGTVSIHQNGWMSMCLKPVTRE